MRRPASTGHPSRATRLIPKPVLIACALLAAALVAPAAASAHGIVGRQDLPIPEWLFSWGAAVVLVVSFVGLAVLWPTPRLEPLAERRIAGVPRFLDPLCGVLGIAFFVLLVYAGYAGSQTPRNNILPMVTYVHFWVGLVPLSVLLGNVFAAFSPWRAIGRGAAWVGQRLMSDGLPDPLPYPRRLGRWPAALGLLAFAWIELVDPNGSDPSTLATLALAYAGVQLIGMSLYGVEAWTRNGDAFGTYFGLLARLSPLRWSREGLFRGRALSGLSTLDALPGTVAVLVVMIGTTSFDGFTSGPAWRDISPDLTDLFVDLGLNPGDALQAALTVGLLTGPLLIAGVYRLGVIGMRWMAEQRDAGTLSSAFAHSLVPIAVAYVVAHYFSLLAYDGQAAAYLASDPLGEGSDLLGTASAAIDYSWISANAIAYVQVGTLVAGHVAGLMLAHDRALVVFGSSREATRSQYWMLFVMIAFTSFGLWLLFKANA